MNRIRHTSVPRSLLPIALAAPLMLGMSGCTEVNRFLTRAESKPAQETEPAAQQPAPEPIPVPQEKPKPGRLYEWNGEGRRVSHIVVNTDEQKARFYDGEEQVGWTTVASGVNNFPTPTGQFEVLEKVANKRSNLYGKIYGAGGSVLRSNAKAGRDPIPAGARFEGAHMPYFLRLTGDGIGLHAGPIPRPGRPASHGCIRMPSKFAPVLFEHVDLGTKVSIVGSGPSYGNYVQKQRALAARERERREAAARAQAAAATGSEAASRPGDASNPAPPPHAGTGTDVPATASIPNPTAEAPIQPAEVAPSTGAPSYPSLHPVSNSAAPGLNPAIPAPVAKSDPPETASAAAPSLAPPVLPLRPAAATVPAPAVVPATATPAEEPPAPEPAAIAPAAVPSAPPPAPAPTTTPSASAAPPPAAAVPSEG
jgi:L,D-transpeptidase catalytic domain